MGENVLMYGLTESVASGIVDFTTRILTDGQRRNRMIKIGNVKKLFGKNKFKRKGFDRSEPIWLTDVHILKYTKHPKADKGATLPLELMPELARVCNNPKYIYQHKSDKNMKRGYEIYVGTIRHPNYKNMVKKAVVHKNFKMGNFKGCVVKSYGIVNKNSFRSNDYKRIK